MSDPQPPLRPLVPDYPAAMAKAAQQLDFAAGETDLAKMKLAIELGHAWIDLASLLLEHQP